MRPTLLLADDSVTIQRVVQMTFADEDITVVAVGDGDEAIRMLDATPPAIVLADVGMPGRNGYDIARHLKANPGLARIPVLLLTGAFEPIDSAKVTESGCDGVLAKPFEPQVVVARVKELLARSRPDVDVYLERLGGALSDVSAIRAPRPAEIATPPVDLAAARAAAMEAVVGADAPPIPHTTHTPAPDSTRRRESSIPTLAPLSDAFAALLAAEQSSPVPPSPAVWPVTPSHSPMAAPAVPVITEDFVEQVTRRVLDRLSDQVVRETVTDIVAKVAEAIVREEIERIKKSMV